MFKKILSLLLVVVMCAGMCMALASCSDDDNGYAITPVAKENIKIGLITLHDENSTYDKNFLDAMDAAVASLGLNKDTQLIVKKNIPESDECYKAAAELVDAGCQVIFADSFGHEDFMMKAAAEFPEVQFCHATGTKAHTSTLPNYHNAFASIYEGRAIAGVIGGIKLAELEAQGKLTAANYDADGNIKIGYVGAFPYAEVISGFTSYFIGVKSGYSMAKQMSGSMPTNSVVMEVKYTNSWYDEAAEKSAAEALIGSGCALMSQHADSYGAPTACQAAGVPNVSYNGSTKSVGATTYLISSKINWAPYYELMINAVIGGYKIQDEYCGGFAEGSVQLTELNRDAFLTDDYYNMAVNALKMTDEVEEIFSSYSMTKDGEPIKSYMANVHDDPAFAGDTEVIKTVGEGERAYYVFQESKFRSAPYFDIIIDGIKVPQN
ncbi:MAG: BMP family ABC transporter substrate-binding protein [Clostridia bacterium]|nr:BMP family ABC transporter substrate-binding protein [Clostridia bacterium]